MTRKLSNAEIRQVVKLAKHCPAPQPVSNIFSGYDNVARDNFFSLDDITEFSLNDNLINEMHDTDLC